MSKLGESRLSIDYVDDIPAAISDIRNFTSGLDFTAFQKDKKTIYAVIRCLEIIGEAVKNISVKAKSKYPHIPWQAVAGMRDKLIHDYFGVDLELAWDTVQGDLNDQDQQTGGIVSD